MHTDTFLDGLLGFLQDSPTPYHAVQSGKTLLDAAGFRRLMEDEPWGRLEEGLYYTVRSDSSLIAFAWSREDHPLRMAGAHTDSPGLRMKPKPSLSAQGCGQVGVEVYGGALLHPWFDRDLSLAGRVCWLDESKAIRCSLVDFLRPIAVIPSLAIHLDREANQSRAINKQTDLAPVLIGREKERFDFLTHLLEHVRTSHPQATQLLDFDLFFYDVQPPARIGLANDLLTGARLDNLVSCYTLLAGISAGASGRCLIVLNDHEEVGSTSSVGAQGPFLSATLERLLPDNERRHRALGRSLFISVDNAHAVHPNYSTKHDPQHLPGLNKGPVIKINANQRYATSAVTGSLFRRLCASVDVPVQEFVMRNDLACGSTIGPLTAAGVGVPTVDVGVPSLAMHSVRETIGVQDSWDLYRAMTEFLCNPDALPGYAGVVE